MTSDGTDGYTDVDPATFLGQYINNQITIPILANFGISTPYSGSDTEVDDVAEGSTGTFVTSVTTSISDAAGNSSTEVDNDTLTEIDTDTGSDSNTATEQPDADGTDEDMSDSDSESDTDTVSYTDQASGTFDSTSASSGDGSTTTVVVHSGYGVSSSGTDTVTNNDAPNIANFNFGSPGGSGPANPLPFADNQTDDDRGTDAFSESSNSTVTTSGGKKGDRSI